MIGNNYTISTRDAWVCVPGNFTELTYNANNKVTQIDFYHLTTLVYSQVFTYDANGNCVKIECVAPSN